MKSTEIEVSIPIPCTYRKDHGLDWVQSSCFRWIYVLLWSWVSPILKLGSKRQLTVDDLFDLSSTDECQTILNKFEKNLNEHEKAKVQSFSIWKVIIKTFWKEILFSGLILVPYIPTKIAQPLLLKQIVLHINDSKSPAYVGYLYAIGLGLCALLQALMHQQFFFRTTRVGAHVRIALSSIIYKRLLSLPARALVKTTTGQIINLISNDASKFDLLSVNMHHIWSAPIEACVVFGLIWIEIGLPTLFGYAIFLLLIPLQFIFSRQIGIYTKDIIKWTDKRVKVINEILVGCQIVKMYRWEEALEEIVYNSRRNEFKSIRKASRIRAMNLGLFFSALPVISLATFGGSWLMGQTLSSAKIFMVISLFSIIRQTVTGFFPFGIEKFMECRIAAKRINDFMNLSRQEQSSDVISAKQPLGTIVMSRASFSWNNTNQSSQLEKINLNITNSSLIGIIGSIGSCKSSLLSAILGEMSLVEGTSQISGRIAYVCQTPWIFAGTIRENIIFCKSFDQDKYDRIIKACQIVPDLRTFSAGDLTVIGEKGVNLSGGQKARVTLARALYTEADIYLFDDPLAAVDVEVARKIFQHCISNNGFLKTKTRLLVTHQIQFLSEFDYCIHLNQGQIDRQGTFDELMADEKIRESYRQQVLHSNDVKQTNQRHDSTIFDDDKKDKSGETSILKEETSQGGTVNFKVWLKLFTSSFGWFGFILLLLLLLLGEAFYDTTNKWLSIWASKDSSEQRDNLYIFIYLGLVVSTLIIALVRSDYFFHLILCGASILHNSMFKGVLYSSLRFYESNPIGRILNRFSKDQQIVDELLPMTFSETVQLLIMTLGSLVIIGIANPWVLLILIPIVPVFVWLRRYYLKTSREIKRLESITRSPIYALFSSSLSGLMTIRAFEMQNEFIRLFIDKINANTRVFFVFTCSVRWFGLRLDLMTCCLTLATAILSVALRDKMDASAVALGLSYCITLTSLFQWAVRQSAETENYMTSTERIDEYSRLSAEEDFHQGNVKPPLNWPSQGQIEFQNYKLRYRPELPHVLKGINLTITPTNKIGIIGRTGAGKSSIFQALFRLTDRSTTEGQILIDNVDIHNISLSDLRSILNIIPQSPVLFSNTLRYNLDPFRQYTDEQLWNVLEDVQLKTKIEQLDDRLNIQIAEYGSNFSVGECQLICIARAILKQSKILLIDEATAHVDTKTDQLIQKILREKFLNQTIITIAHRLNTIMDSDQIIVMDKGIISQIGTPFDILQQEKQILSNVNDENELIL